MHHDIKFLDQPSIRKFIRDHMDMDPHQLLLNPPNEIRGFEKRVVEQIISRNKIKNKHPGWFANDKLIMPPPVSVEQSSSDLTSCYKSKIMQGGNLIDLTGGTGIDTLALSKSFESVSYVEKDPWLSALFHHNASVLGQNIKIINSSAEDFLQELEPGDHTFYIDPDRRPGGKSKVYSFQDAEPDILVLLPVLLEKGDRILVKSSPMLDISAGLAQLMQARSVHVVAVGNDVKELLFLVDRKFSDTDPTIHCLDLTISSSPLLIFTLEEEKSIKRSYSPPGKFLLDPHPTIMKSGGFGVLQEKYKVQKVGPSTHLFTSHEMIPHFPGRAFEIIEEKPSKQDITALKNINVISRNHPLSAPDIKKKYKIRDGGDQFLIAFRDMENKSHLVICNKLQPDERPGNQ